MEKLNFQFYSGRKTEEAPVLQFNFLGLPIRPGEKECPQYNRNGSCNYGLNCMFDHPDPSLMGEGYTGWEDAMPFWPSAVNGFGPFETNIYQPAQYALYSYWNGYQFPLENHGAPTYTASGGIPFTPPPVSSKPETSDVNSSQQQQQNPKPKKQLARNFKAGFGVHHPKTSSCPVNDKGLPLRPDTEVCAFYNRLGICKRGAGCKFDHPVPQAKSVPAAESAEAQRPVASQPHN